MINLEDALPAIATNNSDGPPLAPGAGYNGENGSGSPDV